MRARRSAAEEAGAGVQPQPERSLATELARQQQLLATLQGTDSAGSDAPPVRTRGVRADAGRGLQAYRANAGAAAERALASTFPVVQALVGAESFAALARACWRACPPTRGDLAAIGGGLAAFIEGDPQLADVPYLADVARLEWLVARAEVAADAPGLAADRLASLHVLADFAPDTLFLALAPGAAVLRSGWPVGSVWQAHRAQAPAAALDAARARMAARMGETVFVCRPEWAPCVEEIDEASACFLEAVVEGRDLAHAVRAATGAAAAWSFEDWLARAIPGGWLAGARHGPASPGGP